MMKIAIIGLGAVTRNIHLPAYAQMKDKVQVVAGCDIDPHAQESVAKKWKVPAMFGDLGEMIEKTKPDIVSICTPPSLHYEQCLMALDHGCHVFCEKPMASDLNQAKGMMLASESAKRHVVINSQFPHMDIYRATKEMIDSPDFGRLLFLHAWQTFRRTESTEAGWRGQMQKRLCYEFGVHVFDLVCNFFDSYPDTIFAHMPGQGSSDKTEVVNTIALNFPDGRGAAIVLDRLTKGPHRYLEMTLSGEHASIHTSIGGELKLEAGIHTEDRRPFIDLSFVKGGKAVLQNGTRSKTIAKEGFNPFAAATARHFSHFIDAIISDNLPHSRARDHLDILALVFAAYESAQSGRPVDMKSFLKQLHNDDGRD